MRPPEATSETRLASRKLRTSPYTPYLDDSRYDASCRYGRQRQQIKRQKKSNRSLDISGLESCVALPRQVRLRLLLYMYLESSYQAAQGIPSREEGLCWSRSLEELGVWVEIACSVGDGWDGLSEAHI